MARQYKNVWFLLDSYSLRIPPGSYSYVAKTYILLACFPCPPVSSSDQLTQ